jgi:hypothetical protein
MSLIFTKRFQPATIKPRIIAAAAPTNKPILFSRQISTKTTMQSIINAPTPSGCGCG